MLVPLVETEFKTNKGRWFLTQWVVKQSNSSPKDVVAAKSLLDPKESLEKLTEENKSNKTYKIQRSYRQLRSH